MAVTVILARFSDQTVASREVYPEADDIQIDPGGHLIVHGSGQYGGTNVAIYPPSRFVGAFVGEDPAFTGEE
jgi:hypothetical protein